MILILHLDQPLNIDTLRRLMTWVPIAEAEIIPWPVQALAAGDLSYIEQQVGQAGHAIISVAIKSNLALANLLIGSVA